MCPPSPRCSRRTIFSTCTPRSADTCVTGTTSLTLRPLSIQHRLWEAGLAPPPPGRTGGGGGRAGRGGGGGRRWRWAGGPRGQAKAGDCYGGGERGGCARFRFVVGARRG